MTEWEANYAIVLLVVMPVVTYVLIEVLGWIKDRYL